MTIRIQKVENLLTARPEGMDFETYKRLCTEQYTNSRDIQIVIG